MLKIVVHAAASGTCQLTKKETDGFVVTFEDGTVREALLSPKALVQLLSMKAPVRRPAVAQPQPANGDLS